MKRVFIHLISRVLDLVSTFIFKLAGNENVTFFLSEQPIEAYSLENDSDNDTDNYSYKN
jgi:hypothetical protein